MSICGFCGTEVMEGFTVCSGCGANLRRNPWGVIIGFFVIIYALFMLVSAISSLLTDFSTAVRWGGIGLIVLAVGVLIFKGGWTKCWYRKNV